MPPRRRSAATTATNSGAEEAVTPPVSSRLRSARTPSTQDDVDVLILKTPPTSTSKTKPRNTGSKQSTTTPSEEAVPVTPSRRSTRQAALRANGLIHDAVEEITGRRTPRKGKTSKPLLEEEEDEEDDKFHTASSDNSNAPIKTTATDVAAAEEEEEISDLSDVNDPHFPKIMSKEAGSAAISATAEDNSQQPLEQASSSSEADTDLQSMKTALTTPTEEKLNINNSHVVFDSDAELPDDEEKEEGEKIVDSHSESEDEDEAPEMVSISAPHPIANQIESEQKTKKNRRQRHRKRGTAVSTETAKDISTAMEKVSQLNQRPGYVMPTEIPQELQMDDEATAMKAKDLNIDGDGMLDMSVLKQFAQESKEKNKKQKRKDRQEGLQTSKRKKKQDGGGYEDSLSRVVSGIRVTAMSQSKSKMGLLENLSQKIPPKVGRFTEQKQGGRRVQRSDPLVAIARRSNHAAINFFK